MQIHSRASFGFRRPTTCVATTLLLVFSLISSAAWGEVVDTVSARPVYALDEPVRLALPVEHLAHEEAASANNNTGIVDSAADETILSEDFESAWPTGDWSTFAGSGTCTWDRTTASAYAGSYSLSPVVGTCAGNPTGPYPENVQSWAVYGPFDLSGATSAAATFRYRVDLEDGADYFMYLSSVDGVNFSGFQVTGGDFSTWQEGTFDLTDRAGLAEVWLAFVLQSDGVGTADQGVLLDDVVITRSLDATTADLALQTVDVDPGPYAPGSGITVYTETENIGSETSAAWQIELFASTDTTITDADTSLGYVSRDGLPAGGRSLLNISTSLGGLGVGQYYIGAIITVVDANDTNHVNHDPNPITISNDPVISVRPLDLEFTEIPADAGSAASAGTDGRRSAGGQELATDSVAEILAAEVARKGVVRVIVGLDHPFHPHGNLPEPAAAAQRSGIASAQSSLLDELRGLNAVVNRRFRHAPFIALSVDEPALRGLLRSPRVTSIEPDRLAEPTMSSSNQVIGSPLAWAEGYDGSGWSVAVLDTGVDGSHPWFTTGGSKIVSEACFSTDGTNTDSLCPGGVASSTAPGAGANCDPGLDGCAHGTHVAGTVAGNNGAGPHFGVARGADIIAIQVFTQFNRPGDCNGSAPCTLSYTSDQIGALEHVLDLSATMDIAAANMSLGGGRYYSSCDGSSASIKAAIDNLRSVGVATVIATGNNGYTDSISFPGCVSSAISVGATTDADAVASFSNIYPEIDLLAPGVSITSSVPGGGTSTWQGTSMATPHVAGAWAVMKQADPGATVDEVLGSLNTSATLVDDQRNGGVEIDMPRINLGFALQAGRTSFGIFNEGPGTLDVTSIAPDEAAPWIGWTPAAPFSVPPNGLQVVTVSVDFDQAPAGASLRRLLITSNDADTSPYPGGVNVSVTTYEGPAAPGGLSASDGAYTDKVRLTWTDGTGEDEYVVYRCAGSETATCVGIASLPADSVSHDDTGAGADGTVHYYRLKACHVTNGCSGFSAADTGYRLPSPPAAPGNVSATDGAFQTKVVVSWDDVATETGYLVYRCSDTGEGTCSEIASPDANVTSHDDTGASADGTVHYYRLKACNAGGCSGFSAHDPGNRSTGACYELSLAHTGSGLDPDASPSKSTGCPAGRFLAGELIGLSASPADGWVVSEWTGADEPGRGSPTNQLTMPAALHGISVRYIPAVQSGGRALFIPVTPCRIFDTRQVGGKFGDGATRDFRVWGQGLDTLQGGAFNCGVPETAVAAQLNFTAVNPSGFGYLRAWPYGLAEPLATLMPYTKGQSVSNSVALELCNGCASDITVKLYGASTHLAAEVVGYYQEVAP